MTERPRMEYVNCNLCGSDSAKTLFRKRDKFGGEEFSVVECARCGLGYVNPRPSAQEIGRFYPPSYSWKEASETGSRLATLLKKMERVYRYHLLEGEVSKVARFKRAGKVLDVGCGTGDRLDAFRKKGFETAGIEPSASAEYARDVLKLDVKRGDLFSAFFPGESFDIVSLYHVLEHTHHPLKVCEEIHRVLKPDGLLVIQVPNRECFQYRVFKERWAAFDVPRDLYYFGTATLASLLTKAGFDLLKIDPFMDWWHPPTLVLSLFPQLDPQRAWKREGEGGSSFFQRLIWMACTFAASPLTYAESLTGHGALVTVYAGKRGSGDQDIRASGYKETKRG